MYLFYPSKLAFFLFTYVALGPIKIVISLFCDVLHN